jgi:hypothetical protein
LNLYLARSRKISPQKSRKIISQITTLSVTFHDI